MTETEKIINACKRGKKKAFTKLYSMYAPKMLGVCMRYCKSREEAEDVVQEGFIKVFQKIDTFAFKGSFDGWIRRLMVNTAINHFKANKKYYEHEFYAGDSSVAEDTSYDVYNREITTPLAQEVLMNMIQRLPQGYRMVFNLFVFENLSHAKIARILDISESTSKTQLFKARRKLKKELADRYGTKI